MTSPTFDADHFAFYQDGPENSSTIIGSADNGQTLDTGVTYQIRYQIVNTNGKTGNQAIAWEYNHEGGGWTAVDDGSPAVIQSYDSASTTHGGDCTQRLASQGNYVTDNNSVCENDTGTSYTHTASYYSECLFVFRIIYDDVNQDDVIQIRPYSANVITYNITASLTVNKPIPPITINAAAGSLTATGQQAVIDAPLPPITINAAAGALTITGQQATIDAPPAGVTINAAAGALTLSGQSASIYEDYAARLLSTSPIALYPLNEESGATAYDLTTNYDAAYGGSGITLNNRLGPLGDYFPDFPGTGGYVAPPAGLRSALDGDECTIAGWIKIDSWASGHHILYLSVDGSNYIRIQLLTTSGGAFRFYYIAGGTVLSSNYVFCPTTQWVHLAFTISQSNDEVWGYLNGMPVWYATGLGDFTETGFGSNFYLFTQTSSDDFFDGSAAYWGFWNSALSAATIKNTLFGGLTYNFYDTPTELNTLWNNLFTDFPIPTDDDVWLEQIDADDYYVYAKIYDNGSDTTWWVKYQMDRYAGSALFQGGITLESPTPWNETPDNWSSSSSLTISPASISSAELGIAASLTFAGSKTFLNANHGYETLNSESWTVDGEAASFSGGWDHGAEIIYSADTDLQHPGSSGSDIANKQWTLTVNKNNAKFQYDMYLEVLWSDGFWYAGYVMQIPYSEAGGIDSFVQSDGGSIYDITSDTGEERSNTTVLYDASGGAIIASHIDPPLANLQPPYHWALTYVVNTSTDHSYNETGGDKIYPRTNFPTQGIFLADGDTIEYSGAYGFFYGVFSGITISAAVGSLSLTGQQADIIAEPPEVEIEAGIGSLTLTGQQASIDAPVTIAVGIGALTITGQAATIGAVTQIDAAVGALTITGQQATIDAPVTISAGIGALTATGQAATVDAPVTISAGIGALTITGQAATVGAVTQVDAAVGSLTITGQQASIDAPVTINAGIGELTATGQQASIEVAGQVTINAAAGSLTITGQQASIDAPVTIAGAVGSLTITGQQASIGTAAPITINAAAGSLTITGQTADIAAPVTIAAAYGSLTITGQTATIVPGSVSIAIAAGALTLAGQQATIITGTFLEVWATVLVNISPTAAVTANPSPAGTVLVNISPTAEVDVG